MRRFVLFNCIQYAQLSVTTETIKNLVAIQQICLLLLILGTRNNSYLLCSMSYTECYKSFIKKLTKEHFLCARLKYTNNIIIKV